MSIISATSYFKHNRKQVCLTYSCVCYTCTHAQPKISYFKMQVYVPHIVLNLQLACSIRWTYIQWVFLLNIWQNVINA
jgi:hypothetical protein